MFDTEAFITAVQNRPCIWDVNSEDYANKVRRQNAWLEIAQILYSDWLTLKEKFKMKRVQDLKKKWKGLRDYHNREKNKNPPTTYDIARKKRKTPFLDMLQFLNLTKKPNQEESICPDNPNENYLDVIHEPKYVDMPPEPTYIDVVPEPIYTDAPQDYDSEDSQSSSSNTETKNVITFQQALIKSMEKNRENDSDMSFLLSILPEMKSMTPSQNFDFRFEIMKIIKKMKYSQNDV